MAGLDDHFGDDASLDPDDAAEILDFLLANSAERSTSEASQKILWSLKSSPLRITDTPYWKLKHRKIRAEVYEIEGGVEPVELRRGATPMPMWDSLKIVISRFQNRVSDRR